MVKNGDHTETEATTMIQKLEYKIYVGILKELSLYRDHSRGILLLCRNTFSEESYLH